MVTKLEMVVRAATMLVLICAFALLCCINAGSISNTNTNIHKLTRCTSDLDCPMNTCCRFYSLIQGGVCKQHLIERALCMPEKHEACPQCGTGLRCQFEAKIAGTRMGKCTKS